jgi:hypothetical protein
VEQAAALIQQNFQNTSSNKRKKERTNTPLRIHLATEYRINSLTPVADGQAAAAAAGGVNSHDGEIFPQLLPPPPLQYSTI